MWDVAYIVNLFDRSQSTGIAKICYSFYSCFAVPVFLDLDHLGCQFSFFLRTK